MIIALAISVMLNVALAVTLAFTVYLLRAVSRVARRQPAAVVLEASPAAQGALAAAEAFTGLTAEEEKQIRKEQERQQAEARLILQEEFGYDPEYLDRISQL